MKHTLIVDRNDTVLNFILGADLPYSRSKLKSLLKHECISINHEVTTQFDDPVSPGHVISIIEHNKQRDTPLEIIYEDKDILVINKPYKLLTVANRKEKDTTAFRLASDYVKKSNTKNRIFIVHRLDQDTSGVMMFAKSEATQKLYQENWNEIVTDRTYVAIVEGVVADDSDTIRTFLRENKTTHMYSTTSGQEAITHYKVLRRAKEFSVLKINLDTGRKNQIRVHMSDMKHPIIGDRKYGALSSPIKRLGLHAYRLAIQNPKTKKPMVFISDLPPKFIRLTKITDAQIASI